mgnify:CR=1 FL=1
MSESNVIPGSPETVAEWAARMRGEGYLPEKIASAFQKYNGVSIFEVDPSSPAKTPTRKPTPVVSKPVAPPAAAPVPAPAPEPTWTESALRNARMVGNAALGWAPAKVAELPVWLQQAEELTYPPQAIQDLDRRIVEKLGLHPPLQQQAQQAMALPQHLQGARHRREAAVENYKAEIRRRAGVQTAADVGANTPSERLMFAASQLLNNAQVPPEAHNGIMPLQEYPQTAPQTDWQNFAQSAGGVYAGMKSFMSHALGTDVSAEDLDKPVLDSLLAQMIGAERRAKQIAPSIPAGYQGVAESLAEQPVETLKTDYPQIAAMALPFKGAAAKGLRFAENAAKVAEVPKVAKVAAGAAKVVETPSSVVSEPMEAVWQKMQQAPEMAPYVETLKQMHKQGLISAQTIMDYINKRMPQRMVESSAATGEKPNAVDWAKNVAGNAFKGAVALGDPLGDVTGAAVGALAPEAVRVARAVSPKNAARMDRFLKDVTIQETRQQTERARKLKESHAVAAAEMELGKHAAGIIREERPELIPLKPEDMAQGETEQPSVKVPAPVRHALEIGPEALREAEPEARAYDKQEPEVRELAGTQRAAQMYGEDVKELYAPKMQENIERLNESRAARDEAYHNLQEAKDALFEVQQKIADRRRQVDAEFARHKAAIDENWAKEKRLRTVEYPAQNEATKAAIERKFQEDMDLNRYAQDHTLKLLEQEQDAAKQKFREHMAQVDARHEATVAELENNIEKLSGLRAYARKAIAYAHDTSAEKIRTMIDDLSKREMDERNLLSMLNDEHRSAKKQFERETSKELRTKQEGELPEDLLPDVVTLRQIKRQLRDVPIERQIAKEKAKRETATLNATAKQQRQQFAEKRDVLRQYKEAIDEMANGEKRDVHMQKLEKGLADEKRQRTVEHPAQIQSESDAIAKRDRKSTRLNSSH